MTFRVKHIFIGLLFLLDLYGLTQLPFSDEGSFLEMLIVAAWIVTLILIVGIIIINWDTTIYRT